MKQKERIQAFVETIWEWYSRHKRTLPWRDLPDTDPAERAYKVLVSEIMLQQTQVPRVIVIYKEFLRRFPALRDLAAASNKEVIMAWRGMGYNSRALRLRDATKSILERSYELRVTSYATTKPATRNPQLAFPTEIKDLMLIKGIGTYTAAAIRNFAFGLPTPCIDTNIRRILHRTFVGPEEADGTWEKDDGYLLGVAEEVLAEALRQKGTEATEGTQGTDDSSFSSVPSVPSASSEWHAALMDFGSLVQTKRNPKWEICPLTEKGIMKTTRSSFELRVSGFGKIKNGTRNPQLVTHNRKPEPGRLVGSTFIPNRIFRGRVIEALRDAPRGLTLHDIGRRIALDWNPEEHHEWLSQILKKLQEEKFLELRRMRYSLAG